MSAKQNPVARTLCALTRLAASFAAANQSTQEIRSGVVWTLMSAQFWTNLVEVMLFARTPPPDIIVCVPRVSGPTRILSQAASNAM